MREAEWRQSAERHAERTRPWVEARLARRSIGKKHPADDFLFDYYPFSPAKLVAWHPGLGVVLEGIAADTYLSSAGYVSCDGGVTADVQWLADRLPRLDVATRILLGTQSRPAVMGCFGMHEWAMVYGQSQEQVRHRELPLRVAPDVITATVDSVGLRCTHIDAYRFFTPDATPLNSLTPTRQTQPDLEQPDACTPRWICTRSPAGSRRWSAQTC